MQEKNEIIKQKVIERIVTVEPKDYKTLKEEIRYLRVRNRQYKQALKYAGISELTMLIDDFKNEATSKMKIIIQESMLCDYDHEQIKEMEDLLDFTKDLCEQLQYSLTIYKDGKQEEEAGKT